MNTKKLNRPEDIIVGTDPIAIDIIQQIYSSIKDKNENERTFLERCWVLGIEKAYKTETKKLDPVLCTKLLERIYYHLEHKKIWEAKEEELSEIFVKIVSLQTLRDSRQNEIFTNLENAVSNVLQLDFSHKLTLNDYLSDKRNIFNYIVLFFNSIIEKIESSMVSAKAINAFFSVYPELILIVTNDKGKVRFINQAGLKLLMPNADEGFLGLHIKDILPNSTKLIARLHTENKVVDFKTSFISQDENRLPITVTVTIPEIAKDRSEIDELVFIIKPEL
ncbi:MAG: hypothetical protein ACLQQ4_17740 [Bacteroidia bacterium]